MKSQSNSLGISSTNARALSTRISNIMTEIKPTITVRSTRTDPPACINASFCWIDRRVRVAVNLASNSYVLTVADLTAALGVSSGAVKVLGLKAWCIPNNGSSELTIQTNGSITTTSTIVKASDYGSGSRMAGIALNIPDPLSKTLALTTTSTGIATLTSSTSSTAKVVIDFHLRYALDAQ